MNLEEIKAAVRAGKKVFWSNEGYEVVLTVPSPANRLREDQWLIRFIPNGHCIGLTHADGRTLNGKPEDFFTTP